MQTVELPREPTSFQHVDEVRLSGAHACSSYSTSLMQQKLQPNASGQPTAASSEPHVLDDTTPGVCKVCACCRPCLEIIEDIANKVVDHYKVSACLVTLQCPCERLECGKAQDLHVLACVGTIRDIPVPPLNPKSHFNLFRYSIPRRIPVIVADASKGQRLKDLAVVSDDEHGIRFYAGAPLVLRTEKDGDNYVGTACIVDRQPRLAFSLDDSMTLMQCAADVAMILGSQLERSIFNC